MKKRCIHLKKTAILLCAVLLIVSSFSSVMADGVSGSYQAFDDIEESSPYYEDICYIAEKGIIDGTDANKFSPAEICTRDTLATALYRMAGSPEPKSTGNFRDMSESSCKDAVIWGAESGLIKGMSADTFAPKGKLTREQLVTFLFRYAILNGSASGKNNTNLSAYTDAAEISAWATDSFLWGVDTGMILGTEDGKLAPKSEISRMQAAAIISRYLKSLPLSYAKFKALSPDEQKKTFSELSGSEIYALVKGSDENWPVTSYDLISPANAKETIILYDNNGDLHFNLAWPYYGGFTPESIASIGDLTGTLDVSRDGGDGGCSLTYGKNEDGTYPNDSQRSVPKTSATVRTGTLNIDKYIKVVNTITETKDKSAVLPALLALGYTEEIANRLIADYERWFTRDEVSGPNNIADGAKLAGNEVEEKYGYYGTTAPWIAGDLTLEGGSGQLNTVFSWGALCASGIIYDTATAEIK